MITSHDNFTTKTGVAPKHHMPVTVSPLYQLSLRDFRTSIAGVGKIEETRTVFVNK